MRKILNSMMLGLSATLALVGCGGTTYPDAITAWRDEDIQLMNDVLGQAIPVAPMSSNYEGSTYEHDRLKTIVYLRDDTIDDQCAAYGEILLAADYTYFGVDESLGYNVYSYYYSIPRDGIYDFVNIQCSYRPADETRPGRFIVQSWFENGGVVSAEWPSEVIAETIGTTETVPSFEADRYLFRYLASRDCYRLFGFTTDATVEATYTATLESAGWTIDNSRYDEGYGIYADSPEGELRLEYAYYDDTEDDEDDRFIVYIYVNDAEEETPAE